MQIQIQAKNLDFSYGQNKVLHNINFSLESGDYVGLIGPNGGGKTTLVRIILGLIHPSSGALEFPGVQKSGFKLGYVPQKLVEGGTSFPSTVLEIVESGLNFKKKVFQKYSKLELQAIQRAMEITEITNLQNRQINQLSGGQRQRVLLARALVDQPKILILDEPTTGVDTQTQEKFYQFLRHLNTEHKITIILVSHDLTVVAKETSRVLCLNQTLFQHDNPKDLLKPNFLTNLYGPNFKFVTHSH